MGAPKVKTFGGGQAKPTADAFNSFLLNNLNSGGFQGMINSMNQPAKQYDSSVDMNNPQFAAMQNFMQNNQRNDVANLRERFTGPGARGTVGAIGEASYLAQANPQNTLAMGQIQNMLRGQNLADNQLNAQNQANMMGIQANMMGNMFNSYNNANALGTPQAQLMGQPSGFSQFLGAAAGIAPFALAPFTGGASLGLGGMFGRGGNTPAAQPNGAMNPNWNPQWNPAPRNSMTNARSPMTLPPARP